MSRAVSTFALFCLLLAGFLAALVWWAGWPLVSLAVDPAQRSAPYHVLYFDDAGPLATDAAGYRRELGTLFESTDATGLWQATQLAVPVGQVADEWQRIQALRFPTGSGFVRTVTGRSYRGLGARAPGARRSVLGLLEAPQPQVLSAHLLLIGAAFEPPAQADASAALREAFAGALAVGGRVYWDSPVAVLEGQTQLSHLLILSFETPTAVDEWLFSTDTTTALALLGTRFSNLRLWRVSGVVR
ncbi:MAG: hypothetical protein AAGI15_00520 [Pseudomonadota bacterium]